MLLAGMQGVKTEELNELKDSTNSFIFSCKIQDKAGGTEMSKTIMKMTDKIYHSLSECDRV